jgi:hypothetical protein
VLLVSLYKIDEALLRQLCADKVPESGTLDFKRELPAPGDGGRVEFLKDVSALANCEGGDLVYGISEGDDGAGEVTPIVGTTADDAERRFRQTLDTLEPRILGVQMRTVSCGAGFVLVVRVPASFDGPHSIKINGTNRRFVMRNGTTTSDMSYEQLRSAFDRTASLAERARTELANRFAMLSTSKLRRTLSPGPACQLCLVPLAGLAGRISLDVGKMTNTEWRKFWYRDWGQPDWSLNLDGFIVLGAGDTGGGYAQLCRDGRFEAVAACGYQNRIAATAMADFLRRELVAYLAAAREWGVAGPAVMQLSLCHVDGREFSVGDAFFQIRKNFADRAHLAVPEVFLPAIEAVDLDALLRPQLDVLWQAFGLNRCFEFDEQGAWVQKR